LSRTVTPTGPAGPFSLSARRVLRPARLDVLAWSEPPRFAAGEAEGPREEHGEITPDPMV